MLHKLSSYIQQHGIPSYVANGDLFALDQWWNPQTEETGQEWVKLPATWSAVRGWLGY